MCRQAGPSRPTWRSDDDASDRDAMTALALLRPTCDVARWALTTLADFERAIEQLKNGHPSGTPNLAKAADLLIDQICSAPWKTHDEREKAQALVARLCRIRFGNDSR